MLLLSPSSLASAYLFVSHLSLSSGNANDLNDDWNEAEIIARSVSVAAEATIPMNGIVDHALTSLRDIAVSFVI